MTPRDGDGETVVEIVGVAGVVGAALAATMIDWVPAVVPSWQTTITVNVPGLTPVQAADWLLLVPVSGIWRPWAKFVCPLESNEALPKLLPLLGQALVVTETEVPLVLTEIPEPQATAAGAARVSGSAVVAATVRPERRSL
jgi:hypothetical protein